MQFNGFNKKGIEFLKELKVNNSKAWFEDHRHIWEENILKPNTAFIEEMGETLQILVPTINYKAKVGASLFKIYRDVRFSKDKTPMKSKIGLVFWQGNAHKMKCSCFYMQYTKDEYLVAAGIRHFKTPLLSTYRDYIKDEKKAKELDDILENLKQKGFTLPTPKFKRLPREFDKDYDFKHLALYDAMLVYKSYPIDEEFFSFEIVDKVFKIYDELKDLQRWLYEMTLTVKEEDI